MQIPITIAACNVLANIILLDDVCGEELMRFDSNDRMEPGIWLRHGRNLTWQLSARRPQFKGTDVRNDTRLWKVPENVRLLENPRPRSVRTFLSTSFCVTIGILEVRDRSWKRSWTTETSGPLVRDFPGVAHFSGTFKTERNLGLSFPRIVFLAFATIIFGFNQHRPERIADLFSSFDSDH